MPSYFMKVFLALGLGLFAAPALSDQTSPVGKWKTFHEKTGKARAVVEIFEREGKLEGKIVELIDPPVPDPKCMACPGEDKNQPVIGLRIMSGMEKKGGEWRGGKILDPEDGKSYKCLMKLKESGEKLEVRGFIGVALMGRSQVWQRVH